MTARLSDMSGIAGYLSQGNQMQQRLDTSKSIDFRVFEYYLQDKSNAEQAWEHLEACQNSYLSTKVRVKEYYQLVSFLNPSYQPLFELRLEYVAGEKCLALYYEAQSASKAQLAMMELPEQARKLDSKYQDYINDLGVGRIQEKFEKDICRSEYTFSDPRGESPYLHLYIGDGRKPKLKKSEALAFFSNESIRTQCFALGFQGLDSCLIGIRQGVYVPLHDIKSVYNYAKQANGEVLYKIEIRTRFQIGAAEASGVEEPIKQSRWQAEFVVISGGFCCIEATLQAEYKDGESKSGIQEKPSFLPLYPSLI